MPTFYRIVRTDPPTETDFLSHKALGRRLRHDTPEYRRSWEGISVYDTLEAARENRARFPRLSGFIAELEIAEGGPIAYAKTLTDPNHYDVWGAPAALLQMVRRVLPA